MNSKQKKVYQRIFKNSVQSDIEWKDIEKFLESLEAKISEENGSRVRIELKGERAVFHRPHPEKITDKGAVKSMRRFLENAGVKDDDL
ncbi:MAG: type II toxin-antitoxin system HicA family toxin [Spirochaetales bacterium]|nr:type II toxin-antitoxin system HicA family toxin [Spirochaetales bacterium]